VLCPPTISEMKYCTTLMAHTHVNGGPHNILGNFKLSHEILSM